MASRLQNLCSRLALAIAWDTVQPGSVVYARTPGNGSVAFRANTMIGRVFWTRGRFERDELIAAFRLATPGTHAFDVGANVGLFSVVMSRAVGPRGRVIAVEPVAATVSQLRENLARNHCTNVDIVEGAAAAEAGEVPLQLTDDPALHSAGGEILAGHPNIQTTNVMACTLDELWMAAKRPPVSLVKVDVEGGEYGVLLGAAKMLSECRPALILEVNDRERSRQLTDLLPGYGAVPMPGFETWNQLLVSTDEAPRHGV